MERIFSCIIIVLLLLVTSCDKYSDTVDGVAEEEKLYSVIYDLINLEKNEKQRGINDEPLSGIYLYMEEGIQFYSVHYLSDAMNDNQLITALVAALNSADESRNYVVYNFKAVLYRDYIDAGDFNDENRYDLASLVIGNRAIVFNVGEGRNLYANGDEIIECIESVTFANPLEIHGMGVEYDITITVDTTVGIESVRILGASDDIAIVNGVGSGRVLLSFESVTNGEVTLQAMTGEAIIESALFPIESDPVIDGLLAHYPLDADAGDSGENALNGTVYGAPVIREGVIGDALHFDGSSDYIEIPENSILNSNITTVTAWLTSENGTRTCAYFRKNGGYHIRTSGGQLDISIESGGTIRSGYMIPANEWHHYAVIVNNEARTVEFFVDGEKIGDTHTYSSSYNPNSGSYFIGQYGSSYRWNGTIDNVKIFGRALNESEIQNLYTTEGNLPTYPQRPSDFSGTVVNGDIALSWTDNADNETGFLIQKSPNGSEFDTLAVVAANLTSFVDTTALPGETYYYRIHAFNQHGYYGEAETIAGSSNSEVITFVTEGSSFSPVIVLDETALVEWTFADGSTSSETNPTVEYGSAARRVNTLSVTPWSAVRRINIGYNRGDGGSGHMELVEDQMVSAVTGLEVVAPYLLEWCSSFNQIDSLDFSNFVSLEIIECYYSETLRAVNLQNTPLLSRACFENCDLESLDLSQSPNLGDLRGARNRYTSINYGDTREQVWHICVRDNPQITENFPPFTDFPRLRDLYIWNTNQSGVLHVASTAIGAILANNNNYTSLDLTGSSFSGGTIQVNDNSLESVTFGGCTGMGRLELRNNNLTDLDLTGITTLHTVRLDGNSFTESVVENILLNLDQSGVADGVINLTNNAAPNAAALTYAGNLIGKGWEVHLDSSTVQVTPLPPSNLALSVDLDAVTIGWRDNSLNEDGFIVEKSADNVTFTQVAQLPENAFHYIDTAVVEGASYYYRVISYNAVGTSAAVLIEADPVAAKDALFASYAIDGDGSDGGGNGLHGTVMGNLSFVDGVAGQAGDFDATDDYIDVSTDSTYDLTEFSVSAWLQSDNGTRTCAYIHINGNFHIRTSGGTWDAVLSSMGNTYINSGYTFVPGEWHHHVLTVNNLTRTVNFYVDGVKVGETHTLNDAITNPNIRFDGYIGQYSSSYMWDGRIDGVNFYEKSLTEAEVAALYAGSN